MFSFELVTFLFDQSIGTDIILLHIYHLMVRSSIVVRVANFLIRSLWTSFETQFIFYSNDIYILFIHPDEPSDLPN